MDKWEYKTVLRGYKNIPHQDIPTIAIAQEQDPLSEDELNGYGDDGWELVSVTPLTRLQQGVQTIWYLQYIFKRSKR